MTGAQALRSTWEPGPPGWGGPAGSGASPSPQGPPPAAVPSAVLGGADLFLILLMGKMTIRNSTSWGCCEYYM